MTTEEKVKTKEKILTVARELFSVHGFKGTSVRLIAEKSNVNLAAINYHFGSKDSLYWSIMNETFEWLEKGVEEATGEAQNIDELSRHLYQFLSSDEHYVVSAMKTFLSDTVPPPEANHPYNHKMNKEYFGPPGGEYVIAFIKKHYGEGIEQEAIEWAVLSIFSSIFHFTTMACAENFKEHKEQRLGPKHFENTIAHMSEAVIDYMKKNPQLKC